MTHTRSTWGEEGGPSTFGRGRAVSPCRSVLSDITSVYSDMGSVSYDSDSTEGEHSHAHPVRFRTDRKVSPIIYIMPRRNERTLDPENRLNVLSQVLARSPLPEYLGECPLRAISLHHRTSWNVYDVRTEFKRPDTWHIRDSMPYTPGTATATVSPLPTPTPIYLLLGPSGVNGTNGTNGVDGRDGRDGTNGTNGADGEKGETGASGTDGIDGIDGEKGDKGEKGDTGEPSRLDYSTYEYLNTFSTTGATFDFDGVLNWYVAPPGQGAGYCWANMEVATAAAPHTWLEVGYSRWSYMSNTFDTGMGTTTTRIQPNMYYRLSWVKNSNSCDMIGYMIEYE
ncbi:hypothetical protein KIPB_007715 [Kipferlia bialata]|uniref:Collagen triple helix repeat-containing protein n=1 Tax=Kipferlia bialata TaxID=797122 RepID=A0A9K3D0G0_9EUKA|nr:hypothetical protein KIPB_007715 [Kipferlia bialata]|eukprot:g7715.t1